MHQGPLHGHIWTLLPPYHSNQTLYSLHFKRSQSLLTQPAYFIYIKNLKENCIYVFAFINSDFLCSLWSAIRVATYICVSQITIPHFYFSSSNKCILFFITAFFFSLCFWLTTLIPLDQETHG